jgi:hypothetical protein
MQPPSNISQLPWSTVGPSLEIMSLAFPAFASRHLPSYISRGQPEGRGSPRDLLYFVFEVGISSFSQRVSNFLEFGGKVLMKDLTQRQFSEFHGSFQRVILSPRSINMACHRHGSSFLVLPKSLSPFPGKMDSEHQASGQVTTISNCKQGSITCHSIHTVIVARFDQALAKKVCRDSGNVWSCNLGNGLRVRL